MIAPLLIIFRMDLNIPPAGLHARNDPNIIIQKNAMWVVYFEFVNENLTYASTIFNVFIC
jgi:hypothetical protein